jgi:hypothetical protein
VRIAHRAEHAEDCGDRGRDQEVLQPRGLLRMWLRLVPLIAAAIFVLEMLVISR